jgi:hypothetical protein
LNLEFQKDSTAIPTNEWLRQWVISPGVRIDKLILDLTNEEVAHTAEKKGPTIKRADAFITRRGVVERRLPQMAVVAIGEYVADRLRHLLSQESESREGL